MENRFDTVEQQAGEDEGKTSKRYFISPILPSNGGRLQEKK